MITEAKKEPAPAATDTSSSSENINSLYPKCNTEEPKSQEPEPEMCPEWLDDACKDFLSLYSYMTEAEQRAFDLGQIYGGLAKQRGEVRMKVIKLCTDGVCSIKNIENTLETLQHEVGGYIETIALASDLVLICDEEGRLKNKAPNLPASVFVPGIVGDVIVAGVSGDDFCDLSDNMVRYVTEALYRRLGWVLKEED